MAMGNFCYIQRIECAYATSCGKCIDDIYDEYGMCEMKGDDMPPKDISATERIKWITDKQANSKKENVK